MRRLALAFVLVAAGSIAALACPPLPEPAPDPEADTEVGFDWGFGMTSIEGERAMIVGFGLRWGKRYSERLQLRLEGDLHLLMPEQAEDEDDLTPRYGSLLPRAGAAARLSLWQPRGDEIGGDFWIEGGAGVRKPIGYASAPYSTDVQLGIGAQLDIVRSAYGSPAERFGGYLALKTIVPTDTPELAGLFFSVGYQWVK